MAGMRDFLRSCVSTPLNALLSIVVLVWLATTLPELFRWALLDAVWSGSSGRDCAARDAACWLFIRMRANQILYGRYPPVEHWRVNIAALIGVVGLVVLLLPGIRRKTAIAAGLLFAYPPVAGILLRGGVLGLPAVPAAQWGGLMLTVTVAAWTIGTSIPLGLLLAFGRRSALRVVAAVSACYIDIVRGLPLVGILFLAIVMFPLFMPPGIEINELVRALVAFTLFNATNFAEVFRGGLQSVPWQQSEAGIALGLRRWQIAVRIVIPQAITASLPGIVNVCVSVVKETTIILIVGLFDFLGVLQGGIVDPEWLIGDQVRATAYFFAGAVFFVICFSLSRYSARIERAMSAGRRS
ncbi:MAG: amino acid ABC transporter permease [Proteobacteria bacterium]|nr:amino acid ABC transporter permease [Pseudomonadota bacterium]